MKITTFNYSSQGQQTQLLRDRVRLSYDTSTDKLVTAELHEPQPSDHVAIGFINIDAAEEFITYAEENAITGLSLTKIRFRQFETKKNEWS